MLVTGNGDMGGAIFADNLPFRELKNKTFHPVSCSSRTTKTAANDRDAKRHTKKSAKPSNFNFLTNQSGASK